MTDYESLKAETAEVVEPLARTVQTLEKRLSTIGARIADTRVEVERKEKVLADHRETAGEKLSASTSDFSEWQGRLRRLDRERGTLVEALALLERDLRPTTMQKLTDARAELERTLGRLRGEAKAPCEARLTVLLAAVIAEHDAITSAWARLYREHGASMSPHLGLEPHAVSPRLKRIGGTLTGPAWIELHPAPVVETPLVVKAPAAVPRAPQARNPYQDDPAPAQDAPHDAEDCAGATTTPAPDTTARPGDAPDTGNHGDGQDSAVQDAPGSTISAALDIQAAPAVDVAPARRTLLTGRTAERDGEAPPDAADATATPGPEDR